MNAEPTEPAYRRIAVVVAAIVRPLTRRDWDDGSRLPATGGVIVCPNHLSNADPPLVGHYLVWSGRWPRYLAKASLFEARGVGRIVRATGQIPVQRRSRAAGASLDAAADALDRGACVVIYPEGTVTHDPGAWPMVGHGGAARLALRTGVPVVPLGQWGAHTIFDRWRVGVPRLWPRPTIVIRLGDPVDLDDLRPEPGTEPSVAVVQEATERIMAAITAQVEEIRGERAPAERYDLRRDWAPGLGADGRPLDDPTV